MAVAASMAVADFTEALLEVDSVEAPLVSRAAVIEADTAADSAEVMVDTAAMAMGRI